MGIYRSSWTQHRAWALLERSMQDTDRVASLVQLAQQPSPRQGIDMSAHEVGCKTQTEWPHLYSLRSSLRHGRASTCQRMRLVARHRQSGLTCTACAAAFATAGHRHVSA